MTNSNADTKSLVEKGFFIPAQPEILQAIQMIMDSDDPSISDVAELIAQDVGLSAAILKTINSPLYGMSRTISDMKQASFLLGFDTIKMIVSGMMLRRAFHQKSCISLERFWDTATEIANAMIYICRNLKDEIPIEDLYAIGLFHDCGIPAFSVKYPDYKKQLMAANESDELRLIDLEQQNYNTNHAVIGFYIASSWGLPPNICQVILRHHDLKFLDSQEGSKDQMGYAALKLAENIVSMVRRMRPSDDWPYIRDKAFDLLGIDETTYEELYDNIDDILSQNEV